MFKNSSLQTTIKTYSGMNFAYLSGFGFLVDSNTTYYALDWSSYRITIFDANWQYLTYKSFNSPAFMISVNNSLYITVSNYIYKTDKYLNIISQYNNQAAGYMGLFFNSLINTIYVAGYSHYAIDVFDLNLTLVDSISTPNYQPYSIQLYRNYIYTGTISSGNLLVIENKVIIRTVSVCTGTFISSILIDNFGFMALSCFNEKKVYLHYSATVNYTGMSLTHTVYPHFINFDSNGRFVVISLNQIDIYTFSMKF